MTCVDLLQNILVFIWIYGDDGIFVFYNVSGG